MMIRLLLASIICFVILVSPVHAQYHYATSGVEIGFGLGGMIGNRHLSGNTEFQGRVFLRHDLSSYFRGELGIGVGSISDYYFETNLLPFDYRLILLPFPQEDWSPYLYGGFGFVSYDVTRLDVEKLPLLLQPHYKTEGTAGYVPFGFGFHMTTHEDVDLDFNFGYNATFTDELNGVILDDAEDGYWTFLISMTLPRINGSSGSSRISMYEGDNNASGGRYYNTRVYGPDWDGDGLSDDEESKIYGTNPFVADEDGDGLNDGKEILTYHSNPKLRDTDGDGLDDGDEIRTYFSDPIKRDTDNDGLEDGDEALKYHTNPLDPDTDHGGVKDGVEVANNMDPLNIQDDGVYLRNQAAMGSGTPNSNPNQNGMGTAPGNKNQKPMTQGQDQSPDTSLEVGSRMIMEGIIFRSGSAEISPASEQVLQRTYRTLMAAPSWNIQIQGHTDNVGGYDLNMELSRRRAESVKYWLVDHGISEDRISVRGFGYSRPVATNYTEAGKQRNRRIEFVRTR